jgi:hypothetical protein
MANGLRFGVLRGADMLALDFELVNLQFVADGTNPPSLRPRPGHDAFLIVHFPPQHLFEQAFRGADPPTVDQLPARAILSDPSRLVFAVTEEIPFTLASLLDWDNPAWSLQVATPANLVGGLPGELQTAIEIPFRLPLSLDGGAKWEHAVDPITQMDDEHLGWTELWHTRLESERTDKRRVWVTGARRGEEAVPFEGSIDPSQRTQIAAHSLAATTAGGNPDILVDRLMLSSLGAWLDLDRHWDTADPYAWRHTAGMGRDHYVRVAAPGFLYPFGHRALRTTITERLFSDNHIAYLQKREFLTVVEPERSYRSEITADAEGGFPHGGREFPFATVRILTVQTPPLDELVLDSWPKIAGRPFRFDVTAQDWTDAWTSFQLPLAFVPLHGASPPLDTAVVELLAGIAGRTPSNEFFLNAQLDGQRLTIDDPSMPGAVPPAEQTRSLTVHTLAIGDTGTSSRASGGPSFLPRMHSASISVDAVDRFVGEHHVIDITPATTFLENGFAQATNKAQTFAEVVGNGLRIDLSAEQAGGFLAPALGQAAGLNIVGLSRTLGTVSGHAADLSEVLTNIANQQFDPRQFLGDMKILGTIGLEQLISQAKDAVGEVADLDALIPTFTSEEDLLKKLGEIPNKIPVPVLHSRIDPASALGAASQVRFLWKPALKAETVADLLVLNPQSQLRFVVSLVPAGVNGPGGYRANGVLSNFTLSLLDLVDIAFESLSFRLEPLSKPRIEPKITSVAFKGDLEFVSKLQALLETVTGDLPFDINVTGDGIRVHYGLGLPSFGFGIFSVRDIAFSASLFMPLLQGNALRLRFALSERNDPFSVSVGIFGGGGFFALEVATDGSFLVELSVEFGGTFSISVLVAEGTVWAMAGIYIKVGSPAGPGRNALTGYLRAGGAVQVLGLVGVSIEFYMGLNYDPAAETVSGMASVTACVEALFLSKCVSFGVTKTFKVPAIGGLPTEPQFLAQTLRAIQPASNNAGAGFADLMSRQQWADYCRAFAAQ